MKARIPEGLQPVRSARPPVPRPQPLTKAEVRDVPYDRSIGPRGYGSALAPWIPERLDFGPEGTKRWKERQEGR